PATSSASPRNNSLGRRRNRKRPFALLTAFLVGYRGVRRIGDRRDLWSAPAKRSGDGALTVPELRAERAKAGSRFACPRTPKLPAQQPNVAHPTVCDTAQRGQAATKTERGCGRRPSRRPLLLELPA